MTIIKGTCYKSKSENARLISVPIFVGTKFVVCKMLNPENLKVLEEYSEEISKFLDNNERLDEYALKNE